MAQYKIDNITDVYWASNEGFKSGRDPLGIQNSSVATYSVLLPGLTNLTGHIRYYSLYCWLLDEYDRLDKLTPQKVHQYNFIRRFELAMAILMNGKGVRAVVGTDFVDNNNVARLKDGSYFLPDGAVVSRRVRFGDLPKRDRLPVLTDPLIGAVPSDGSSGRDHAVQLGLCTQFTEQFNGLSRKIQLFKAVLLIICLADIDFSVHAAGGDLSGYRSFITDHIGDADAPAEFFMIQFGYFHKQRFAVDQVRTDLPRIVP